jgi:hypothetical protein
MPAIHSTRGCLWASAILLASMSRLAIMLFTSADIALNEQSNDLNRRGVWPRPHDRAPWN